MTMLSPVCPFFTHHISTTLYNHSAVDWDEFPEINNSSSVLQQDRMEYLRSLSTSLQDFNGMVWNTKKENGTLLNQPIQGIEIPVDLVEFQATLTRMHHLE